MSAKTQQLQIRVTPQQKAALKRQARAAGCDMSSYVLSRLMPAGADRFAAIIRSLRSEDDQRFALAELNDFLASISRTDFTEAVADEAVGGLSPYLRNYVAAMVEQAAASKELPPPPWVRDIRPLDAPHFVTPLKNLRMHLLQSSPVPFKRRNIFVDSGVGARV